MKKSLKSLLVCLFVAFMLLVPMTDNNADDGKGLAVIADAANVTIVQDGIRYYCNEVAGTANITGYDETLSGDVVIPDAIAV